MYSKKFRLTPKGLLIGISAGLALVAILVEGGASGALGLGVAVAVAGLLDISLHKLTYDEWPVPSGAIITGAIVGLILRPQEPWFVPAGASAIAIVSKHLLRTRWSNIFNPAALGLVAAAVLAGAGESWWGSLPNEGVLGAVVLLGVGGYTADRVNKVPAATAFAATYFGLFTAASFFLDPTRVAEVFRPPDLQAALFFAVFMVDDPPTSPVRLPDQVVFGVIAALSSFLLFLKFGAVYFLPASLLIANAWESARRVTTGRRRHNSDRSGRELSAHPSPASGTAPAR